MFKKLRESKHNHIRNDFLQNFGKDCLDKIFKI
jgi:hypothetical protein